MISSSWNYMEEKAKLEVIRLWQSDRDQVAHENPIGEVMQIRCLGTQAHCMLFYSHKTTHEIHVC